MPQSFRISTKPGVKAGKAESQGSEMFHVEHGIRQDASLHAPILSGMEGSTAADLVAVREAVAEGVPMAEAADLYAGAGARMILRRQGLL
jgi:hypothetical protein